MKCGLIQSYCLDYPDIYVEGRRYPPRYYAALEAALSQYVLATYEEIQNGNWRTSSLNQAYRDVAKYFSDDELTWFVKHTPEYFCYVHQMVFNNPVLWDYIGILVVNSETRMNHIRLELVLWREYV